MAAILTLLQQQSKKVIAPNWAVSGKQQYGRTNYEQLEEEVEEDSLAKLVGVPLLQELQDNPNAAVNVLLLDGGTFTDCNKRIVKFKGLRYVLAYLVYHDYVSETPIADTYTGLVNKTRNETTSVSAGTIKKQQHKAERMAMKEWELCKEFLNENDTDYPLWICDTDKKLYTPKIITIKRTAR